VALERNVSSIHNGEMTIDKNSMPQTAPDFNHNQPVYSVSEVSSAIKRVVEDHFGVVRLRGELTGYKQASSGHAYFRLKDDNAVMDGVCWRGTVSKLGFKPEDGLEVVCRGKVTTYPGRSSYQIVVDHMEPAGAGALMALLEKRKKALEEEGLFAAERKKPIPYLPRVVGVVTSPTGAVIRDILHRISERFPVHVLVWPVMVQGEGAAEQVAAAIEGFNAIGKSARPAGQASLEPRPMEFSAENTGGIPRPDVLIVARGGGSLEDLWAFNEEVVVRAAAASDIPLISAVGHETDTTLIDYASDMRAPTPTGAAEKAVPVREELRLGISQLDTRLGTAMQRGMQQRAEWLEGLNRGLPKPMQLLQVATQRFDDWSERLQTALPAMLDRRQQQLALAASGLRPQAIGKEMTKMDERLYELQQRMLTSGQRYVSQREERLHALEMRLESVNYQRVLERGFALVKDRAGKLVTSRQNAKQASELTLTFSDGDISVKA
jgi:exodeoxyribonuclease VII large subunit